MDVFEAMSGRRSVRSMSSEDISAQDLDKILQGGRVAASWANTQCWEIVVVRDPKIKKALAETLSATNPARKATSAAPVVIVACGKKKKAGFRGDEPRTILGDWLMFDVALFLSNITHGAHALGYGTVHVGSFNHREVSKILGIPDHIEVVEIMPIGKPLVSPSARVVKEPTRRALEEFIHLEKY